MGHRVSSRGRLGCARARNLLGSSLTTCWVRASQPVWVGGGSQPVVRGSQPVWVRASQPVWVRGSQPVGLEVHNLLGSRFTTCAGSWWVRGSQPGWARGRRRWLGSWRVRRRRSCSRCRPIPIQGYLAHKKPLPRRTLGAYGGPRGVAVSYKRGTPVPYTLGRGGGAHARGVAPSLYLLFFFFITLKVLLLYYSQA